MKPALIAAVVVAVGAGYLWWRRRPTVDSDGKMSCPEGQSLYQDHRGESVTWSCKSLSTGDRPEYVMGSDGHVNPIGDRGEVFDPANYILEPGPPPYYRRRRAGEGPALTLLEAGTVPTRARAPAPPPPAQPLPVAGATAIRSRNA